MQRLRDSLIYSVVAGFCLHAFAAEKVSLNFKEKTAGVSATDLSDEAQAKRLATNLEKLAKVLRKGLSDTERKDFTERITKLKGALNNTSFVQKNKADLVTLNQLVLQILDLRTKGVADPSNVFAITLTSDLNLITSRWLGIKFREAELFPVSMTAGDAEALQAIQADLQQLSFSGGSGSGGGAAAGNVEEGGNANPFAATPTQVGEAERMEQNDVDTAAATPALNPEVVAPIAIADNNNNFLPESPPPGGFGFTPYNYFNTQTDGPAITPSTPPQFNSPSKSGAFRQSQPTISPNLMVGGGGGPVMHNSAPTRALDVDGYRDGARSLASSLKSKEKEKPAVKAAAPKTMSRDLLCKFYGGSYCDRNTPQEKQEFSAAMKSQYERLPAEQREKHYKTASQYEAAMDQSCKKAEEMINPPKSANAAEICSKVDSNWPPCQCLQKQKSAPATNISSVFDQLNGLNLKLQQTIEETLSKERNHAGPTTASDLKNPCKQQVASDKSERVACSTHVVNQTFGLAHGYFTSTFNMCLDEPNTFACNLIPSKPSCAKFDFDPKNPSTLSLNDQKKIASILMIPRTLSKVIPRKPDEMHTQAFASLIRSAKNSGGISTTSTFLFGGWKDSLESAAHENSYASAKLIHSLSSCNGKGEWGPIGAALGLEYSNFIRENCGSDMQFKESAAFRHFDRKPTIKGVETITENEKSSIDEFLSDIQTLPQTKIAFNRKPASSNKQSALGNFLFAKNSNIDCDEAYDALNMLAALDRRGLENLINEDPQSDKNNSSTRLAH